MLVELAVDDFLGGAGDQVGLVPRQRAQPGVDLRGGLLDQAKGADESPSEAVAGDGEVLDGPLGGRAP